MTADSVSIIVPTFNRARYIGECLDSLIAQTVAPCEILVVDDGSDDATAQVVARYSDRVRYVFKQNGGKPSAVNLGLEQCTGSLVWLFDDDDVALPDAIERRLATLAAAPGADWVYSSHVVGSNGEGGKIVSGRLCKPLHPQPGAFFLEIMKNCFFHLNSALVRRECYGRTGGLDPSLLAGQDYDLQIRLSRIARPVFCESPSFIFRQHDGVRGTRADRYEAAQRSDVFRQFSATIGRKLRHEVTLGEFLVPPQHGFPPATLVRSALLNRIHVMANHGCIPEVFEDLQRLLDETSALAPLTASESARLACAVRAGFAYEASVDDWPEFVGRVRGLKRFRSGDQAVRALARGLLVLAKSYPGTFAERVTKARHAAHLAVESYR